jgi:KRAB domain-containing zinc finger protein
VDDDHDNNDWHSHIALRKHYAESHRNIWDVCDICGLVLRSFFYLKRHRSTHSDVKDYTCEHCGKGFTGKYLLRKHIRSTHEKGRAYNCDICQFVTYYAHMLKRHKETIHVKSVKYECDQCNYFSRQKEGLDTHINVVHKKLVRYKCEHCEKQFYWKRDKMRHMEKNHSEFYNEIIKM